MTPYFENGKQFIYHGFAGDVLPELPEKSIDLVWTDPPFNTGKKQVLNSTGIGYSDKYTKSGYFDMMVDVFAEVRPLMKETGVVCVCLDYRSVHDVKVDVLDIVFGAKNFRGEVIWHSELGGISSKWWTNKHNTILLYSVSNKPYFNKENIPTTSRKAPKAGYESPKKVTSVWDFTMSNTAPQRVGYPNQKPLEIISPFVKVHCPPTSTVLDPFMGSGSTLVAARNEGHRAIGIDSNLDACIMASSRLK